MNVWQIVLTVGLVGAGLVAYDTFRGAAPQEHAAVVPLGGAPRGGSHLAEAGAPATLRGSGDERWRAEMERRLAAIEDRVEGRAHTYALQDEAGADPAGTAPSVEGAEAAESGTGTETRVPVDPGAGEGEGGRGRYSREELQAFRGKLDVVERQRRRERAVRDMNRLLGRLDVALTDDQRRSLIRATLEFQARARGALRGAPTGDRGRDERMEAARQLRDEFQRTVYDLVPAAEAEPIVEALNRYTTRSWRGDGGRSGRNASRTGTMRRGGR